MVRFAQSALLASVVLLASPGAAFALQTPDQTPAAIALDQGRADEAIQILRAQLSTQPHDATAHQLLCRVYYAEENFRAALPECQAAVSDAPSDADDHLWLGRTYGMKASQVNPILAFTLARKVVAEFERAVELDPTNVAAMRDLGEYYVNAPAIVGGGLDKARALATKMMPVSAAKAHRLLAQIAEKSGDDPTAEAEFKRAVEAQRTADSFVDLAQFYLSSKQFGLVVEPIETANRLDRPRDSAAVDAAAILVSSNSDLPLAEQLLREYLASAAKSDCAPAFKVHVQLGDLLLKRSDRAGAEREYDAALALASAYEPAKRSRQQASHLQARQDGSRTAGANAIP